MVKTHHGGPRSANIYMPNSELRAANSPSERWMNKTKPRKAVKAAKNEHRYRQIKATRSPADIHKLMRSLNPRQARLPPPFIHEEKIYSDQSEQAVTLRDALLTRYQASEDLPPQSFDSDTLIPWEKEVTDEEAHPCTIGCESTAPGADGVSVELLKACWNHIGPFVTKLFQACISLDIHPTCFKLAEVVFLEKPNRDPSFPKGWRPIGLLSSLGKGLERLLTKRMAKLAVAHDIVGK